MKKEYLEPEVELLKFKAEDIITTSENTGNNDDEDFGDI